MENTNRKAILLIDGDNANKFDESAFSAVFTAAKKYGYLAESHIFVNGQSIKGDKKNEMLLEMVTKYALHLHVLPIKKNSTDISLAIRASEKLFTDGSFDTYIIVVAGDHDYMPLAIEIRQHNKKAVCFYIKDKDPTLLSAFCSYEKINTSDTHSTDNKKDLSNSNAAPTALTLDYAQKVKNCFKFNKENKCYVANLGGYLSGKGVKYKHFNKPLKTILDELFNLFPDIFKNYKLNINIKSSEHIIKLK